MKRIGKYWHKRNEITQSPYIGTYTSTRLKKSYTEIRDTNIFPWTKIEHLYDNYNSNNNPISFDDIHFN